MYLLNFIWKHTNLLKKLSFILLFLNFVCYTPTDFPTVSIKKTTIKFVFILGPHRIQIVSLTCDYKRYFLGGARGYRRKKWTRRHEFKSWTRLIAFHIVLITLGKVWIQLFSLQLWVNSRADLVLQPWWGN